MKSEMIRLLRESEEYISGQELCDRFQVSRTAVWKIINQLKEEGYVIEAKQNKGYRLLESPDTMAAYELESRMCTKWAGRIVSYKKETGSTNIDCKKLAEQGEPHGALAVAEMQVNGRGRRGRGWQSPAGESIYMSLLCRPDFAPDKAPMLTLVMGVSVAEAVERYTGLAAKIKWPNDIVVNGRKICGILTEMEMGLETKEIQYLVIGVGINVNNGFTAMRETGNPVRAREAAFPDELQNMATSLFLESERKDEKIFRAPLVQYVMEAFEKNYELFLQTLDLSLLKERYNSYLVNRNAAVKVLDPKGEYTGIALEIDNEGDLLVETEDRGVIKVYSGEVSVRGLYGYT
ncbi:MAG: biotin--[acetyl-CoA-carboxylase] ligase [Lachnospiraceae bacterium]|nr:biotin--[acetyl-CoA-carboxylase] ligase [Lachnospiraceae bacterium]